MDIYDTLNKLNIKYEEIEHEPVYTNIKEIANKVNTSHLSFASPEELKNILDLEPGSVTPLGIINDKNNKVTILIDSELKTKKILCHPNTNTKTVSIEFNDLIKFIEYEKHKYYYI